jgi:hypothetical protein
MRRLIDVEAGWALWSGLGLAVVFAILSAWLGIWMGRWMRGIQR